MGRGSGRGSGRGDWISIVGTTIMIVGITVVVVVVVVAVAVGCVIFFQFFIHELGQTCCSVKM